jgi:hypothetical protein
MQTWRLVSRLRRVGDVCVLAAPLVALGDRKSARVILTVGGRTYSTHAFRLPHEATVVVPKRACADLGLKLGVSLGFDLSVRDVGRSQTVPPNLNEALRRAGASLDVLTEAERRQALMLVREAATEEVQQVRIDALVRACLEKAKST